MSAACTASRFLTQNEATFRAVLTRPWDLSARARLRGVCGGRRRVALDHLIPRTDRSVGGGATYLAAIEATAREPGLARSFIRDAAMIDIAPDFREVTA